MEFTPNKAWIFVYLFVVRILPDIHCRNKIIIERLTPFFVSLIYRISAESSQIKLKIMDKLIDYCTSNAMPTLAYKECISNNQNKKGGKI